MSLLKQKAEDVCKRFFIFHLASLENRLFESKKKIGKLTIGYQRDLHPCYELLMLTMK